MNYFPMKIFLMYLYFLISKKTSNVWKLTLYKYTDVEKPFSNKLFNPSIGNGFLFDLLFDL